MDTAGSSRASIIVQPDGTPTLRLADQTRGRVGIDITPDGSPGFALLGTDGKTRASLTVNADGVGALTLFDANGTAIDPAPDRLITGAARDGRPTFFLRFSTQGINAATPDHFRLPHLDDCRVFRNAFRMRLDATAAADARAAGRAARADALGGWFPDAPG